MLCDDPAYADIPIEVIQQALHAEGLPLARAEGPIYNFILFNLKPDEYRIDQPCTVTEHSCARVLRLFHPILGLERPVVEKLAETLEKVMGHADDMRRDAKGRTSGSAA
jgi:hypothetical protein